MNSILSTIQTPTPQVLLLGKDSNRISHEWMAELANQGIPVHILDCAIRFNVFRISEQARLSSFAVLHRIFVQRAFTPYQLLDTIAGLIEKHKDPEVHSKFYFFLNPTKQFFDGDVKDHDRDYLLPILARQFQTLRELGFRFLISESRLHDRPDFHRFLDSVRRSAVHFVWDASSLPANRELLPYEGMPELWTGT